MFQLATPSETSSPVVPGEDPSLFEQWPVDPDDSLYVRGLY